MGIPIATSSPTRRTRSSRPSSLRALPRASAWLPRTARRPSAALRQRRWLQPSRQDPSRGAAERRPRGTVQVPTQASGDLRPGRATRGRASGLAPPSAVVRRYSGLGFRAPRLSRSAGSVGAPTEAQPDPLLWRAGAELQVARTGRRVGPQSRWRPREPQQTRALPRSPLHLHHNEAAVSVVGGLAPPDVRVRSTEMRQVWGTPRPSGVHPGPGSSAPHPHSSRPRRSWSSQASAVVVVRPSSGQAGIRHQALGQHPGLVAVIRAHGAGNRQAAPRRPISRRCRPHSRLRTRQKALG